jgi:lysophospholipase L1-like esterase
MYLSLVLATLYCVQAPEKKPFEFKDGDRLVWIGSTLVEREQRYGYWETALLAANPGKRITVRNLGWSGDTVHGEARGRFDFDKADVCFKQLVNLTLELKPTVIFISYGTNESFEGEEGLPKFEKGLEKLLDALKPANAKVVLFTPAAFMGLPGPEAAARRQSLRQYGEVVRRTAEARGAYLADLQDKTLGISLKVSDNGIHPTEDGYRHLTYSFLMVLGYRSDDRPDWAKLEPLRQAVIAKNELFFHRWRPQNETYLFGFRKHEQGKNAKEVAEFDPLVAKAEEEVERIRKSLK